MWLRMTFNCTGKQPEAGNIETENTMFKETFTALAIVAGLVATAFTQYGMWCWVIGFGVLHIIYGFIIYTKYEK